MLKDRTQTFDHAYASVGENTYYAYHNVIEKGKNSDDEGDIYLAESFLWTYEIRVKEEID